MRSHDQRFRTRRVLVSVALAAIVVAMVAPPADAKRRRRFNPRFASAPLFMTSFVQHGRIDVRRNEGLVFKFSAYPKKNSVDDRSIRIGAVTPSGVRPAIGALRVKGRKVIFDPTQTQRSFDESKKKNSTVTCKDNFLGFDAFQDYSVEIPGPPELAVLKNLRRERIKQGFTGSFRSNGTYNDPVPGQPRFVGDFGTGKLGFSPPRSGSTGLVDEDALVIIEFSEPMDPATLDPSSSVIVTRTAIGEQVPGFIRVDPTDRCGTRYQFVPSLGFGSDEVNLAGWDVEITLTTAITDLAGNSLKRPVVFPLFRTRYVPGKPSSSILAEGFDDQDNMDTITIIEGGEWNTLEAGFLLGGAAITFPNVDFQPTSLSTGTTIVRTRVAEPLVAESIPSSGGGGCTALPNGSRCQMLYVPADIGDPGAIVATAWGPSSNALFAATYPDIELLYGHTSAALGSDWGANVNLGNPVTVYQGNYDVPQALNIMPPGLITGYWDYPAFTTPFEFNGINNVVFDAIIPGGNNCQILRIGFVPTGISFPTRRAVSRDANSPSASFATDPVMYDTRFKKRRRTTRAVSAWYELASDDPLMANPIVSPSSQSGGVQVVLELEGAHGKADPFNPGGFIADVTTATGYTTQVTDVDGHRFVRFRITMIANLNTNQTARISSTQVPYQF